jgi:hypothetical protein
MVEWTTWRQVKQAMCLESFILSLVSYAFSASWTPEREQSLLTHAPSTMLSLNTGRKAIWPYNHRWNLWNCEPKWTFHFQLLLSGILSHQWKSDYHKMKKNKLSINWWINYSTFEPWKNVESKKKKKALTFLPWQPAAHNIK